MGVSYLRDVNVNYCSLQYEKEKTNIGGDNHGLLAPKFTAHVPVPSQQDIEAAILRKKKQELLEKYGIAD